MWNPDSNAPKLKVSACRSLPREDLSAREQFEQLTVIIPTLNEVGSIGELLRDLSELMPGVNVLVVDDGSNDGTPEAVQLASKRAANRKTAAIQLLDRREAQVRGITASVLDAVERCQTQFFIVMDGDLQHPASVVPNLFDQLQRGSELVVAARAEMPKNFSILRTVLSKGASQLAALRLVRKKLHVRDPLSGFFGVKTEYFRKVVANERGTSPFQLEGYKVLFDFLKLLPAGNERISNIFYRFGARTSGESKLATSHALLFLRSLIR